MIEINGTYELENEKPVLFKCERGGYRHFSFRVDEPCIVKIDTWPLDDLSDPDLYVGIDSEQGVDRETHTFKSEQIGAAHLLVHPENPDF